MFGISVEDFIAAAESVCARKAANARYEAAPIGSGEHWDAIRDAWAPHMEGIAAGGRRDPYFLNWQFTPIERNAWCDIRTVGIPLYPQCPVAGVFVDFADPHLKIGLELDGKAFHDRGRDTLRDERLWSHGWRIFRVTGAESYRFTSGPLDDDFDEMVHGDWARTTMEGIIWSLGVMYYGKRFPASDYGRDVALSALDRHRLVDFPLSLDGED